MSYNVYKTNPLASPNQYTVEDGVLNQQTDISFIGKGYSGYGEVIAENFLHLLENFSNSSQPANPITGQLWYDENSGKLKVYNGSQFGPVGGASYVSYTPGNLSPGDLFVNAASQQLYFWNGSAAILVGPPVSSDTANGLQFVAITDTTNVIRNVTEVINNGQTIAIISNDAFTPKTGIAGYPTIAQGINLTQDPAIAAKFVGTATNANFLNGVSDSSFLRNDANANLTGTMTIANNTPLTLGKNSDLKIKLDFSGAVFQNDTQNAGISFKVNDGGIAGTTVLFIDGATARVGIGTQTPSTALDVTGTVKATAFSGPITGAVSTTGVTITPSGSPSAAGSIVIQGATSGTQTKIAIANPTGANTITLPNRSGTVITTADSNTVTANMLKTPTTLQILNSAGSILKSLTGAGA
jgi:hypothetical protein